MFKFDDETIERLFGADDAENETEERFKEYFYSNKAYEALISALPVRVLVGHKGVGKSALLKMSYLEDLERGTPCIWLKPDELVAARNEASKSEDFILRIEAWKKGIMLEVATQYIRKIYGGAALATVPEIVSGNPRDLARLIIKFLDENGPNKKQPSENIINIYIDDIDRGWSATANDIRNISALLNAIRDIGGSNQRIRFRIGLRSDVYFLVRTSDESTDKIERNVIWLRWTNDDILRLAAKRIVTYFKMGISDDTIKGLTQAQISSQILSKVITPIFAGRGKWENKPTYRILMSLTRARPRDLVKLFHASARRAYQIDSTIITTKNLEDSFEPYSQERLQDIINEFKSEMPDIKSLLLNMKPSKKARQTIDNYLFNMGSLSQKLQQVMGNTNLRFSNGNHISPRSLTQFLYKIDFITARKEINGNIERKYFDESRFLANDITDFGYDWEIHPAYRWALQPQDIQSLIASVAKDA
jgi:hypothetical protein